MSAHGQSGYQALCDFLGARTDYENQQRALTARGALDLGRVRALTRALGSPERAYPVVHVAGTKGKGTTAALVAAILQAHGLRTGRYASPHLLHLGERVVVDGAPATEEQLGSTFRGVEARLRRLAAEGVSLTFFEILTAIAFCRFRDTHVDAAVIEVGLGGRLDATNVVAPKVCVITTIDYEHTRLLGERLASIAHEKAGILKAGVPVVVGPVPAEARAAILERARAVGAGPVIEWGVGVRVDGVEVSTAGTRARIHTPQRPGLVVSLALHGRHMAENAALAVATADALFAALGEGSPSDEAVMRALASVRVPGRFSLHDHGGVPFRLDAAHTPASSRALADTWAAVHGDERPVVVFGALGDKNLDAILAPLRALKPHLLIAAPCGSPRSRDPAQIASAADSLGLRATEERSIPEAVERAHAEARDADGVVLVTGSIYLLGAVTAIITP